MEALKLDAKSTALVLIDLQHGIVGMQGAPYTTAAVVEKGAALAKAFHAKKAMVVYVRVNLKDFIQLPTDAPARSFADAPDIASEIVPEVGAQPTDLVITKRHWGAFGGTQLEAKLREAGVTTIVMAGISTSVGVDTTARQAAGLGFALAFAEDACTASSAEEHAFSVEKIFPRLGRVRTTAEIVDALG